MKKMDSSQKMAFLKRNLVLVGIAFVLGVSPSKGHAQSSEPVPPPLIIKNFPLEDNETSDPVRIDITNPKARSPVIKRGEISNPIPLEVKNVTPVEAVAPKVDVLPEAATEVKTKNNVAVPKSEAKPVQKLSETGIRIPAPQTKPVRIPLPPGTNEAVYNSPKQAPTITVDDIIGEAFFSTESTNVGRQIVNLQRDLFSLQDTVQILAEQLDNLEKDDQQRSARYHASIATINTQLQSGTTPGNPRLLRKLIEAQEELEGLNTDVTELNELALRINKAASLSSNMLDKVRVAYEVAGAVETDHVNLAILEDNISNTSTVIERLLNNANDDISRATTYLGAERENLRTLSLAVTKGDLYSKSLASRPFSQAERLDEALGATSSAPPAIPQPTASAAPLPEPSISPPPVPNISPQAPAPQRTALSTPRPLVKIKFDKQNVDYEQPVYDAVNAALEKYPNAQFDLVAVNPSQGNAAQIAIESTRARRNAERVLRTLTQMGLDTNRVNLSYTDDADAVTNEVHLYIR